MAVQSYSYLGGYPGPSIDVNLYNNAATSGINQGNARPSLSGAIFNGVSQAITSGLQTASAVQGLKTQSLQNDALAAKNQTDTDQGVVDARTEAAKNTATAQAAQAKIAGNVATNNQTAIEATAGNQAKVNLVSSGIQAADSVAKAFLTDPTNPLTPQQTLATFSSPQYIPTYARDPVFAQQQIQTLRAQGVDSQVLDPLQKQYSSLEYSNNLKSAHSTAQSQAQKSLAKVEDDSGSFTRFLNATPETYKYSGNSKSAPPAEYDPTQWSITPSATVNKATGTPTGYDLTYNGQVVKKQAFLTKDAADKAEKQRQAYVEHQTNIAPPPTGLNQPYTPQNTQAAQTQQGVGLQKEMSGAPSSSSGGITEKDITPPQQGQTKDTLTPYLKTAVDLSGFSPQVIKEASPAVLDLGKTIDNAAKSFDPKSTANLQLLEQAEKNAAQKIAYAQFKQNPALQATITQATVDAYNRGISANYLEAQGHPDFTEKYNTALTVAEEKRFQTWVKSAGKEKDLYDYDMRGAWKAGETANGETGHWTDKYKKPNHPTFSVESQYSTSENPGGTWKGDKFIAATPPVDSNYASTPYVTHFASPETFVNDVSKSPYLKNVQPHPLTNLMQALRATSPEDYYYKTHGSSILKQVQQFSRPIFNASAEAQQQTLKATNDNTSYNNILKGLAGGGQ